MSPFPRVRGVVPLPDRRLRVTFSTGETRVYDCTPLLDDPAFEILRDGSFFRTVRADRHGYGVVWNDDVDLSESELWIHGTIDPDTRL